MDSQPFFETTHQDDEGTTSRRYEPARALPILPASLFRFLGLVADPSVPVQELTQFVWSDPALLSRALPLALRSDPKTRGSIRQSIGRLGRTQLRRMAFTMPMLQCTDPSGAGPSAAALWERSQACAAACEMVGRHLKVADPEQCYVAGLLHDIGYLVLLQNRPKRLSAIQARYLDEPDALLDAEVELIGIDHCEAGVKMAALFGLPSWLWPAIGEHHVPTRDSDPLTKITAVASMFCTARGLEFLVSRPQPAPTMMAELQETIRVLFPGQSGAASRQLVEMMDRAVQPVCRKVRESIVEWQLLSEARILPRLAGQAERRTALGQRTVAALA